MKKTALLALASAIAFNAAAADAPNADAIKAKAQTCAACHGPDGNSTNAMYPRLAGQYHDYISRALHEYKTGERKNAIMAGFAATLSDAEIEGLANYYGAMPGKLDDLAHHEQGSD